MSLSIPPSLINCKMVTAATVMSISAVYSYLSLEPIQEALNNLSEFSNFAIKTLFDLESKNITKKLHEVGSFLESKSCDEIFRSKLEIVNKKFEKDLKEINENFERDLKKIDEKFEKDLKEIEENFENNNFIECCKFIKK